MEYIILDTDAFSHLFARRPQAESYGPILQDKVPALTFTSVTELYFGAYKADWGEQRIAKLEASMRLCVTLPFDENLPRIWADIRKSAHSTGHALGQACHANDLWIAASAVYYDAPLLTGNIRHFQDLLPNLRLIDGS